MFNPKKTEVFYRNMMESCKDKKMNYRIIDDIKIILNSILSYSNKNNKTRLLLINVEKFIRTKITNKKY